MVGHAGKLFSRNNNSLRGIIVVQRVHNPMEEDRPWLVVDNGKGVAYMRHTKLKLKTINKDHQSSMLDMEGGTSRVSAYLPVSCKIVAVNIFIYYCIIYSKKKKDKEAVRNLAAQQSAYYLGALPNELLAKVIQISDWRYVGQGAWDKCLQIPSMEFYLEYPIQEGNITNWDHMEKVDILPSL